MPSCPSVPGLQLARAIACRGLGVAVAMGSMFALFTWFWIMNLDVNADLQRVSISFLDESIQVRATCLRSQSTRTACGALARDSRGAASPDAFDPRLRPPFTRFPLRCPSTCMCVCVCLCACVRACGVRMRACPYPQGEFDGAKPASSRRCAVSRVGSWAADLLVVHDPGRFAEAVPEPAR